MARPNLAKLILTELFQGPKASQDFGFMKGVTDTARLIALEATMQSLEQHGIIHPVAWVKGPYAVHVETKRPKKIFTPENSTVDEVYGIYQKRTNADRLFSRYKTYEGPRGNEKDWKRTAESVLSGRQDENAEFLTLLGLKRLPTTKQALNKAWKKAMLKAHPDKGGDVVLAQRINTAYEALLGRF